MGEKEGVSERMTPGTSFGSMVRTAPAGGTPDPARVAIGDQGTVELEK